MTNPCQYGAAVRFNKELIIVDNLFLIVFDQKFFNRF